MIEPFYFADPNLFGIYHPAEGSSKRHAVVIAGPLLNESMRAHHALRKIAMTLAESGIHVLRFDYEGMGNSAGNIDELMPDQWIENLRNAVDELVEISGERKVSIIAVRFAACLAARVAQDREIEELILWDPISRGEAWSNLLEKSRCAFEKKVPGHRSLVASEYMGHILDSSFISKLKKLDGAMAGHNVSLTVATNGADILNSLRQEGAKVIRSDIDCGWEDPSSQVLYPHDVVAAICDQLT